MRIIVVDKGSVREKLLFSAYEKSTKISADDIHEWIHDHLKLDESKEDTRYFKGTKCQVSIKFCDKRRVMDLVKRNKGQFACEHTTGEIVSFKICPAGFGLDRIRLQIYHLKLPRKLL
jgi:hypothetical protein